MCSLYVGLVVPMPRLPFVVIPRISPTPDRQNLATFPFEYHTQSSADVIEPRFRNLKPAPEPVERISLGPLAWRICSGPVVPTPILAPVSNIVEFSVGLPDASNLAMKLAVPLRAV